MSCPTLQREGRLVFGGGLSVLSLGGGLSVLSLGGGLSVLSLGGGLSVRVGMRCDRMEPSRGLSSSPMSGVVRLRYDHFEARP